MPIIERTPDNWYPGAGVRFYNVVVGECASHASTQLLASELQAAEASGKGCTIIGGQGMTDATLAEIVTVCAT